MVKSIKYFLLIVSWFFSFEGKTQNLVPNFSFEDFEECPDEVTVESRKVLIPNWYLPNRGTSDYYNACTIHQVNVPDNVMGSMFALDGEAYAGVILIEQPPGESKLKKPLHYREYLQTQLIKPLCKDSLYCVQFYFSIASYSTYAVDKLGLYISESKLSKRLSTKVIEVEPQIALDTNKTYNERDYWYQVCDTFRAKGNEQFITIGNFYDDHNTKIEKLDYSIYRGTIQQTIRENKLAYYYIDVVSVTPVSENDSIYCENKYRVRD
jgi:hypothetical protein